MMKDPEAIALWVRLLVDANFKDSKLKQGNKILTIKRGQILTSRKRLTNATGINRGKIDRLLKLFESEQQIVQQTTTKYRIITVTNYHKFQASEQQSVQQLCNNSAATVHIKEGKELEEGKEEKKTPSSGKPDTPVMEIFNFWREVMKKGSSTKPIASRINAVKARLKDGYTIEEIKQAITNCSLSSFHMGPNGKGKHNDLELICRAAKFENFRDNVGPGDKPQSGMFEPSVFSDKDIEDSGKTADSFLKEN